MNFLLNGVTLVILWLVWARAEVFTSIPHIKHLQETQQNVVDQLEKYLTVKKATILVLDRHLNRFKRELEKMRQEEDYVGNPINAFTLIKRLTADLDAIENYTKVQPAFERKEELVYPDKEDLDGAATAMWRLQRVYGLNVSLLAAGVLYYSHNSGPYLEITSSMSISDCTAVGRIAYEQMDYQSTVYWMQEALKKYYNGDSDESYLHDESFILDYLRNASHEMGDFDNALKYIKLLAILRPDHDFTENMKQVEELSIMQKDVLEYYAPHLKLIEEDKDTKHFRALCQGAIPIPEENRKRLSCYFKRQPAFLQLAPVKVELLHQDPEVYLFHEVISDAEIEHLQAISLPYLKRATVVSENKDIPVSHRICKTASLTDDDSAVAARISRRVGSLSGLSMTSAEHLQVVSYGIAGYYLPHYDFMKNVTSPLGNRIATVLFYMSDVEQGGATVFMDLNVTVYPVKNSALMWMNLLPSGEPDFRTVHGACPVVRGHKWISTKWLRAIDQVFTRPCSLQYEKNKP